MFARNETFKALFETRLVREKCQNLDFPLSVFASSPSTEELQNQGVQEVFIFCTRGELNKYRVPSLLEVYRQRGFAVHHTPFPDGDAPELEQCCQILDELQVSLQNNRRTVIQ